MKMPSKFNLNIGNRLYLGFAFLVLLLMLSVSLTIYQVSTIKGNTDRIVNLRNPTERASSQLVSKINASLATLRGWMLTGNPSFKTQRHQIWKEIDDTKSQMNTLSESWTNPNNVAQWNSLKPILEQFRIAQQKVEGISGSPDEQPALKMLTQDAAPLAATMSGKITQMIDLELSGSAAMPGDRVQVLGMMADIRGSLGLGLANIRAFLLTGDNKFVKNFDKLWAKNEKRFADMENSRSLLSVEQLAHFEQFSQAREKFNPLPKKMFGIRSSKKWNMANYTLITEAAPRAGKLLTILAGKLREDGSRDGGMVADQGKLMLSDSAGNAALISSLLFLLWMLAGIGLAAGAAIAFFTVRAIAPPVKAMTSAMGLLAEGELETKVPHTQRSDEIGEMAGAVQIFKDNAIRNRELEEQQAEQDRINEEAKIKAQEEAIATERGMIVESFGKAVSRIANKDLTYQITDDLPTAYQRLKDEFNDAVVQISDTIKEVSSASGQILSGSKEIHTAADNLARRTEQQAASVEETAAAVEQTSTAMKTSAERAKEANELASTTRENAEKSGEVVKEAIVAMGNIEASADKISNIISVIDEISFQTNLLALNAGVEAARAGDAGKGFAVVATEVRELAQRSASAAKEIEQLITTSGKEVKAGVDLVERTGSALDVIVSEVKQVNEHIVAITGAINEQSVGVSEINESIGTIDQGTQQNAAVAEQSSAASLSLLEEVSRIDDKLQEFSTGEGQQNATGSAKQDNKAQSASPRHQAKQPSAAFDGNAALANPQEWEEF